jgi:outer membrane protein TolC
MPIRSAVPLLLATLAALAPATAVRAQAARTPADTVVPSRPLTLLDAIRLGRSRGVNAVLSATSYRIASQGVTARRADILPQISGGGGFTRQTVNLSEFGFPGISGVTPAFSVWRFQLRGSEALLDPAAIVRLRAARDTLVAAGYDAQAVGEVSGATAGLAYLRVLSADETVRARQADSTIAATLLEQARQLVQAGVSPAIDATRSEVSFQAVRTQLEVSRNELDRARLDLLRALDLPSGTRLALADSLGLGSVNLPSDADAAVAFARDHRAELAAERARTEAARRSLSAIRAENLPAFGVSGAYQQSGPALSALDGSWNVQLLLSVPILDGFRRQSRAKAQALVVEAQETRQRDITNQVETEARQAVLDLASAQQQVAIADRRLQLAQQELSQAEERFRAGVAGSVETTNAQSSVIAARDALIQARVSYGTARVSAYRALGVIDQIQ